MDDKFAIRKCLQNTEALQKVNKKVKYFLDRAPLADLKDVVILNRLIEEQDRLVRVRVPEQVPARIAIFNDNERYRACHLRHRFAQAQRRNKIRTFLGEYPLEDPTL